MKFNQMRIRTIKPEFWTHDEIAELPPICRLLFIGLWNMADRRGRLEDRPKRIKATLLPYDDADTDDLLNQLHRGGFIIRYTSSSVDVIQVVGFEKHQRISGKESETESEFPEYTEGSEREPVGKRRGSTREAPEKHPGAQEGKGRERKGTQCAGEPAGEVDPLDIPKELHSPEFTAAWQRWMTFRRGFGKKPKNWALLFGEQLTWLKQFGAAQGAAILQTSIRNGWQGLFEPKIDPRANCGPKNGIPAGGVNHTLINAENWQKQEEHAARVKAERERTAAKSAELDRKMKELEELP